MGLEPTSEAWEASILPLYDARSLFFNCTQKPIFRTAGDSSHTARCTNGWWLNSMRQDLSFARLLHRLVR
jgi:hypothetical protein